MNSGKRRRLRGVAAALLVFASRLPGTGWAAAPASPEISGNVAILNDASPNEVKLGVTLTNAGAGVARSIEISSVVFKILTGSGTVSVATKLPLTFGDLGAGLRSGQLSLSVTWPDTAVRVQMIVEYTAGTYHSRQSFNLYR
jgi:hypothetical protein